MNIIAWFITSLIVIWISKEQSIILGSRMKTLGYIAALIIMINALLSANLIMG